MNGRRSPQARGSVDAYIRMYAYETAEAYRAFFEKKNTLPAAMVRSTPATTARACPKSTCALPGAHSKEAI